MSDPAEFLRQREAQIASAQRPLGPETIAAISGTSRRLRRRDTAVRWSTTAAAVGALAVGMSVGAQARYHLDSTALEHPLSGSPAASQDASASPQPSEAAPEASLIEGFAPVPQQASDTIPWDKVGPGWFAVGYYDQQGLPGVPDGGSVALSPRTGGVSLVSPEGAWYAARSAADLGPGWPLLWDGDNVVMGTRVSFLHDVYSYDLSAIDLKTGDASVIETGVPWDDGLGIGDGEVMHFFWTDGPTSGVVGGAAASSGACSEAEAGWYGIWRTLDMSYMYLPEGDGAVVCFGASDDGTAMTLVDVGDVTRSRVLAELPEDNDKYAFAGWIDGDSFLFARTGQYAPGAEQMFAYDLTNDTITSLDVPFYSDIKSSSAQGFFDRVSQRHVISHAADGQWEVSLYTLDGDPVATVEGECVYEQVQVHTSGGRLMVSCADPGYARLFDMATGDEIGSWDLGAGHEIQVSGHRAE